MFDPETRDANTLAALTAALPADAANAVAECEAFTALAVSLARAADDDPQKMAELMQAVTGELPAGRLEWVIASATVPPAAFLTKRLREHG